MLNKSLANECGLDYDEVMADNHPQVTAEDFTYECLLCSEHSPLSEFKDTEFDGDLFGVCPCCGQYAMIQEVRVD